jgi:hypothetical protein
VVLTGAMAAPTPRHGRPDDGGADRTPLDEVLTASPRETLRALAFWSAVVLPFLHVPLLAAGLSTPGERHAFVALLALNAVALYAGHPHGPE